jgi:hypothetical protein
MLQLPVHRNCALSRPNHGAVTSPSSLVTTAGGESKVFIETTNLLH